MSRRLIIGQAPLLIVGLIVLCGLAYLGTIGGSFVGLQTTGGFTQDGEYATVNPAGIRSARYGSWSGSDTNTGMLTSAPFRAGFGLSLRYSGYPMHNGESIGVERIDDGATKVLNLPDARESWREATVSLPLAWLGRNVRLVAADKSNAFQSWIGIADVRRASAFETLFADVRATLLIDLMILSLFFLTCLCAALPLSRRARLPNIFIFSATLLVAGIASEALFFATMVNARVAGILLIIFAITGAVSTTLTLRARANREALLEIDSWLPFAAAMGGAIVYMGCLALTVSSNTSAMELVPLLSLPSDDALPHILAGQIAAHAPPEPFFDDWLSSDRPPLQAGFDLAGAVLAPFIADSWARYAALSILLQATIFGMIYTLSRLCRASVKSSLGILALSICSGFFFVNTVYFWPKLISASYLAIALAIGIVPGRISRMRAVVIGISTALALLSHGGVAFTIPALLLALFIKERVGSIKIFAIAGVSAIILLAPWSWYQRVYDPPGDRLLKWHLAGHIAPTTEPFSKVLIAAYTTVPFGTIVANKESNVHALFGDPLPNESDREFYFVRYALSALAWPFVFAALLAPIRRFWSAGILAWISIASLAFWCIAMYLPNQTIVHQGSYLTMTLMFIAGGLVATAWWPLFAVVFAFQLVDFISTWLTPFSPEKFFTLGGVTTLALCCVISGALVFAGRFGTSRRLNQSDYTAFPV
jgi:hypothetical protein